MAIQVSHRGVIIAVLSATVATSSCGGGSGGGGGVTASSSAPPSTPAHASRPVAQTNLEIARLVYEGTQRTPDDFYEDSVPSGHEYVTTAHLKSSDIDMSADAVHELCTDDWNEALEWSELSAQGASEYADLVETNEETRFFEFGRLRSGTPPIYQRERVFKCAYLDRSGVDLRLEEGAAGLLNQRPITASVLRQLSEYLWTYTPFNNYGHAVLKSEGAASAGTLTHTLYIASVEPKGISSTCDRIVVIAWRHTANTATGELTLDTDTELTFGARETDGLIELCSD